MMPSKIANRLSCLALMLASAGVLRAQSAPPAVSSWSGVYTEAQAARGSALYAENCAQCHRPDLAGGIAPPLTGPAFFFKWNNRSIAELLDYQFSAMPLNSPGGLSLAQNTDIVAFLLKQGAYPTGQRELPAKRDALTQVKLLATKP